MNDLEVECPLPDNFAEDLLDLEMDLERNCNLDTIRHLVSLYSVITKKRAIEHYESKKDSKYKAYHNRMKSLLQKTQVQQVLTASSKPFSRPPLSSINVNNLKSPDPNLTSESPQVPNLTPSRSCEIDQNQAPNTPVFKETPTKNLRTAEIQIEDYCQETQNSKRHVICNIKNQEDTIENKLKARKINRSQTLSSRIEGDKGAGRDRYQDGIVEIMEKFLNEKVEGVVGIKRKYRDQIEEIKAMGKSQMIVEVIKEMERAMEEEVKQYCEELDKRKAEEIARARVVYFQ